MRDILFRGKSVDTGKWVYGYLAVVESYLTDGEFISIIIPADAKLYPHCEVESYEVITETVGQYTGLKDKNGKKIFEGDLVSVYGSDELLVIEFSDVKNMKEYGVFSWNCVTKIYEHYLHRLENNPSKYEVISNIYDNPELLERR